MVVLTISVIDNQPKVSRFDDQRSAEPRRSGRLAVCRRRTTAVHQGWHWGSADLRASAAAGCGSWCCWCCRCAGSHRAAFLTRVLSLGQSNADRSCKADHQVGGRQLDPRAIHADRGERTHRYRGHATLQPNWFATTCRQVPSPAAASARPTCGAVPTGAGAANHKTGAWRSSWTDPWASSESTLLEPTVTVRQRWLPARLRHLSNGSLCTMLAGKRTGRKPPIAAIPSRVTVLQCKRSADRAILSCLLVLKRSLPAA
jgi:hypothetical protein